MQTIYDQNFYNRQSEGSLQSAQKIIPLVKEILAPGSVVDFGCGVGGWLRTFFESGVEDVRGYEINTLPDTSYQIDPQYIRRSANFAQPDFPLDRNWDLAICLEVAEHIPAISAPELVKNLCRASSCILFSAAIPGQTGVNHINEQPHSYWGNLFQNENYREIDILRPLIHNDLGIRWWYRQNILLYVREELLKAQPRLSELASTHGTSRVDSERITFVSSAILKKRDLATQHAGQVLEQLYEQFYATQHWDSALGILELLRSLELKNQRLYERLTDLNLKVGNQNKADEYQAMASAYAC